MASTQAKMGRLIKKFAIWSGPRKYYRLLLWGAVVTVALTLSPNVEKLRR